MLLATERARNKSNRLVEVAKYETGIQAQHAEAALSEQRIPVPVGAAAAAMVLAVNFDDEPGGRSEEVDDVACDDDLAAKGYAELLGADGSPETRLWLGRVEAHVMRSGFKELLAP